MAQERIIGRVYIKNIIFLLLTVALIISGCTQTIHLPKKVFDIEHKGFHRGLWVRAVSIASPDSIPRILHIAQKLGITDIYVQVVVAGYAYYKSNILPRSQYLSKVSGSNYDPLDSLIRAAHKRSIRVHAWVNALLIWSLKEPPDSSNHILYTHPEWFIKDARTRSIADYSHKEWTDAGLEGLYLDPANQEVQRHLKKVCTEIVNKYPVTGIHLDFIRYPGTLWGLPENDTSAIFAGIEGYTIRWLNLVRYPQLSVISRWMVWHYWKLNRQKEKAISQILENVHTSIKENTIHTKCKLTTAVFPNPSMARYRFAQNWTNWEKILDYPVVMSYTQDIGLFSDFLNFTLIHRPDAVFGIGFLWPDMEAEAYWEVKTVKQNKGAGICFFDFTSIDTMVDFEKLKRDDINEDSLLKNTLRYGKVTNVFTDLPNPDFVKKGKDIITQGEHSEFAEFLLSLSLNFNRDLGRLDLNRDDFINKVQQDVIAFKYLDSEVFPLTDELIEPPKRKVDYEFIPWGDEDSVTVRQKADKINKLTQHMIAYPEALNILARAAFKTEKGKREKHIARTGIYVFEVKEICEGRNPITKNNVKSELLPIYQSWTIKEKLQTLLD